MSQVGRTYLSWVNNLGNCPQNEKAMSDPVNIPNSTSGKESPTKRSSSSTPPADTPTMLTMTALRSSLTGAMSSGAGCNYTSTSEHKQTPNSSISSIPQATSTPTVAATNSNTHTISNHHNHSSHHVSNSSTSHSINNPGFTHQNSKSSASELKRKPSLHVVLTSKSATGHGHNGSSDSLNKSPLSPDLGILFSRRKSTPGSILGEEPTEDKELTYKVQRKNYRLEKLRVAQELSTALKNPSIIILSGSLKVRGKLKGWTKLWAVLRPGMILFYKSNKMKSSHWVATLLLQCCKVIERPSKKDGFCFKVFHPMDQSIWATKGPDGETMGAVVQPLPATYLICRAPSADDGKCWMDGLELALTCSSLLLSTPRIADLVMEDKSSNETENDAEWCASDEEDKGRSASDKSDSDASRIEEYTNTHVHDSDDESQVEGEYLCAHSGRKKSRYSDLPEFSNYIVNKEDFAHTQGEQSEVLADENKSLLWFLLKQVRPGMDLSRVVLPTFILEPRSFLDKLSDYYYHADILTRAVQEDDPLQRMKAVVRWYFSGFYKKPKGLKKPYNPVLGETFRCLWRHPDGTDTFYVAEQVSHHPPVSAFYVSNRKSGFIISSTILAKSKFYGNSTSAILEGQASLTFLPHGEVYLITMPYAHCKGILLGTLSMELGGQVTITCEKTNYSTEMEFKLKGMLSRAEVTNAISGKIKHNRDTVGYFEGHWDSKIIYKEKKAHVSSPVEDVFWEVTDTIKSERLTRYTIPLQEQESWESENLWRKVSEAILADDQEAATVEKTKLEEQQRLDVKDRLTRNCEWIPKYFNYDGSNWHYKHEDYHPWDDDNDIVEYECDYVIATHRKHARSFCRADSAISDDSRQCDMLRRTPSDQVVPAFHQRESNRKLLDLLRQLLARQIEQSEQIEQLKSTVANIQQRLSKPKQPKDPFPITNTILAVVFAVAMQILLVTYWFGDGKLLPEIHRKP